MEAALSSTSFTLRPPPRSVEAKYEAAHAAQQFENALTNNRLRERALACNGQTLLCAYGGHIPPARLPGVLGLHGEQSREEFSS